MAEYLLKSVSEAGSVQQDADASPANEELNLDSDTQRGISRARRSQVSAACQSCRQRKIKCDALRPCRPCVKRNLTCRYDTQHGETHSQAFKRKYEDAIHSHDTYAEVFYILRSRSEQDAAEVLRWIRSGRSPEVVLRFMTSGDFAHITPNPGPFVLDDFLVNLAHSTGSAQDIIRLATITLDPSTKVRLPRPQDFFELRNRIVQIQFVEKLLQRSYTPSTGLHPLLLGSAPALSRGDAQSGVGVQSDLLIHDDMGRDDHPPHHVPAAPWTTITASDEAVSHLVSLFLAWINPTWRFVEQDLFLMGMRSKRLQSRFCSPLLVNSICAIASLQSEHEVAMVPGDRNRITRGQHFHDEALHLWALEENRPTLTNIQALCILGLESNYRAKDRLGLTLVSIAAQLNNEMPVHIDEEQLTAEGVSGRTFARARLNTHWMVVCTQIIMRIAFMSGITVKNHVSGLPRIQEVFDDRVEAWIGYPLARNVVFYRPTLYLRERCRFAGLLHEMYDLVSVNNQQHNGAIRAFTGEVDRLSARMERWYQYLPFELQYGWPMSVAVWELHASYLAALMALWVAARTQLQQKQNLPEDELPPAESDDENISFKSRTARDMLSKALPLAYRATQILHDFRKRYGLKITPAWLLQLQAVAAGVLLQDPELADATTIASSGDGESGGTINDSRTAFDEVFRCLLGTGVQVMVARGIARMMYHTSLQKNIKMSQSMRSVLQIMSDTAWRPSDLSLVSSTFPNYATTKGYLDSERMTELLMKWEALET